MTERTGDRSLFFMEIPPHQSASLPASPPKGGSLLGAPREVTKTDRRGGYHPPAGQRNGKMRSSPTGGVSVGTDRIRPPNFARVKDNPSVDLSVDTLPYTGRARNKSTARRGRRPRRPVKRLAVLITTLPSACGCRITLRFASFHNMEFARFPRVTWCRRAFLARRYLSPCTGEARGQERNKR